VSGLKLPDAVVGWEPVPEPIKRSWDFWTSNKISKWWLKRISSDQNFKSIDGILTI
jgi:hypothetical protein